jgi:hypothetical protein
VSSFQDLQRARERECFAVTWEDALAESRAEGEARGEARGKTQGRLEAARKAIVLLASRCHRDVPPDFEETLSAIADLERLYRILERIVDAPSMAQLDLD